MPSHVKARPAWATAVQIAAITLIALVAGSTFGIWRGYNPSTYSPATFVETHQGVVRGLNFLLPAMAFGALACTAALAYLSRHAMVPLRLYLVAIGFMVVAGLITRFINQPINAEIMAWSPTSLPDNWQSVRDTWWTWHVVRTITSVAALMTLVSAVFADVKYHAV